MAARSITNNDPNATTSYKKGRGLSADEGVLTAAFDGNHGWFWRNRGSAPVTVTLKTSGEYAAIKRVKSPFGKCHAIVIDASSRVIEAKSMAVAETSSL